MAMELKQAEGGGYEIVEEGKAPIPVKAEDLVRAHTESQKPLNAREVQVRVNGVDRRVTVGDALKSLEKVAGADEKFAAAADATKVFETFKKLQMSPEAVTQDEVVGLLRAVGAQEAQVNQAVAVFDELRKGGGNLQTDEGTDDGKEISLERLPKSLRDLAAAVPDLINRETTRENKALVAEIEKDIQGALTSHEKIGTILKAVTKGGPIRWDAEGSIQAGLFQDAMDKVRSRVFAGQKANPELYTAVAGELYDRLVQAGKLATGGEQDVLTSLGPAIGLPPSIETSEPKERVPVGQSGRASYITSLLHSLAGKAKQGEVSVD